MCFEGWNSPRFLRLAVVLLALVSWSHVLRAKDIVVTNDGGGVVGQYLQKYKAMAARGDRLVIDGWCASSCTLALGMVKVCVTSRAQLGFHQAYYGFGIFRFADPTDTAILWNSYPARVKKWINDHGGLKPDILVMKPSVVVTLFPKCEATK